MKTRSRFIFASALICVAVATALITSGSGIAFAASTSLIQVNPLALGEHLTKQPNKLSIVLVSTPGCGFCKLVREQQLAPLLTDPDFKDVAVFEVLMRDETKFSKPIDNFRNHADADLGKISSVAQLSQKLDISFAPTVLFIGDSSELAERLVGYGVPDYYFAYLSEQIDTARQRLAQHQQK